MAATAGRDRQRAGHQGAARCRAGPGRRPAGDERRGPGHGPVVRCPARRAPGREDLRVAAKVGSGQRRPDARRVGRLPPSLRRPGLGRRPRRRHPRHQGIGQAPGRALPLGLQQAVPQGDDTFAGNSRHASPWAAKVYNDARAAGKDHPHAVRILARAWIRVIWPCWINEVPYDPALHNAAAALEHQTSSQPRRLRLTQGVSQRWRRRVAADWLSGYADSDPGRSRLPLASDWVSDQRFDDRPFGSRSGT